MMMKQEIKKIVEKAIEELKKEEGYKAIKMPEILISNQGLFIYGEYSTALPLEIAVRIKKNPMEVAMLIVSKINKKDLSRFQEVKAVKPGFINFHVKKEDFVENLQEVLKQKNNFGRGTDLKNKKVIIDYTDPNPFKEFHIGHLMSNAIGESLSRIFEFQGAEVKRVCYQGDVGIHVAKAVWGIMKMQNNDSFPKDSASLSEKMKLLRMAYAYGTEMYENDESIKKEIISLNKKIFERSDKEVNKLYDKGKKWSLEHFSQLYKKLGTKFDCLIFESEVSDIGKEIVEKGLKNGIFEKSEGAIIFKGEKYGLHTRVFINSEDLPTYEAKDLGLAKIKYKKYKYDQSFVVTGNEVNEYFKVMLCAMKQVLPELSEKTKHIGHGMLRLPEGKMSSRTGKIITAESLLERIEEMVEKKIKDRELSTKEKQKISKEVAVGAIKYSILKQSIGSDIIYDFDKSISFEGDSGPYLQYSYTRAKSVLEKAKDKGIKPFLKNMPEYIDLLERKMLYFEDIAKEANKKFEPHIITLYLTELGGEFNRYYSENKIVDENDRFSPYKVAITKAFTIIMENGLWLLGINPLEKM